jgi:hypothetical protein
MKRPPTEANAPWRRRPTEADALWRALTFGDFEMLAERVNDGSATVKERALAAKIITGKHKPPDKRKVRFLKNKLRAADLRLIAGMLGYWNKGVKKEAIIKRLEELTGLGRSLILAEIKKPIQKV